MEIKRERYLSQLIQFKWDGMVKVVTGIRRSGNYIKSQFYLLLDSLLTEGSNENSSKAYLRCIEYISENFADPTLNIENLCRNSYVCRSTVQRAFNLNIGMSPSQYLTKLRVEKALKTLVSEHMPISEVALKCGFADEKYFSRVFKKIYGFVPSEARKICFCNKLKKQTVDIFMLLEDM